MGHGMTPLTFNLIHSVNQSKRETGEIQELTAT